MYSTHHQPMAAFSYASQRDTCEVGASHGFGRIRASRECISDDNGHTDSGLPTLAPCPKYTLPVAVRPGGKEPPSCLTGRSPL
jgi:hypothetical protein